MLAPLTPGDDPRFAELVRRLPDLGVPVLPLDHERLCRVLPPGRTLGWEAARELLVALLAKDEEQRRRVRAEFRHRLPPQEVPGDSDGLDPDDEVLRPVAAPSALVLSAPPRRWPWWRLAIGATLGAPLILIAAFIIATSGTSEPPGPRSAASPPAPTNALPAQPLRHFNDWVPVFEAPADRLLPWLAPLALLCCGLLALAWLWDRTRRLVDPPWTQVPYNPDGEPVFAWTPEHLRLPELLGAQARRELVWGVQRFASERATDRLDIPATVNASAAAGLPEPRFAPARNEREVWIWLDTRLRTREAVALADQVQRDLVRAGLHVRRGTFVGQPDLIRLSTRERASPMDLGPAARTALVCLFTEGLDLARALERGTGEDNAALERVLRELRTWPRLCLVDLAPPELDLPALAARLGLDCCPPAALPAWLAERPARPGGHQEEPAPAALALRLWAAACALPRLPVTAAQARALYETLGETLGLPPVWRLPAPGRSQVSPDGVRFSDAERQGLLRDLADWAVEDHWGDAAGRESPTCHCLAQALAFWDGRIRAGAASQGRVSDAWDQGPADQAQTIERLLLALWWGDGRSAAAVRALYDLYQEDDLRPVIRERLAGLDTADATSGEARGGRIRLPWTWDTLPEAPAGPALPVSPEAPGTERQSAPAVPPCWGADTGSHVGSAHEPRGSARARLRRMGFAGAIPGARPRQGAQTLLLLGACAGLALAGTMGLVERLGVGQTIALAHDAPVYDGDLFQGLVMEGRQGAGTYAASRKLAAVAPDASARLHWCWSGLTPEQAAPACRALAADRADPRRSNPLPMGKGALLRAGTLAEPIRACAPDWPPLSVAVIAGTAWDWPADPRNNESARRLAIRLLDRGTADLVLIGPDWAEQARALAAEWSFAKDSQWLFFRSGGVPPPQAPGDTQPPATDLQQQVPALGTHRALFTGDLEAMARALDFPGARPAATALGLAATVSTLAGNPRLWGGPEQETGPQGIPFVRVCPGTFTMGSPAAGPDTPEHLQPYDWERPAHPVVLDGFWIARTETTQAQYAAQTGGPGPAAPGQPVAQIDWTQSRAFCRGLAPDADLPTEAQWEYAARGGSQDPYPFPADLAGLCTYANGASNEYPIGASKNKKCSDPFKDAAPVGRFPPNRLGLYDMHGNLWEWVRDCWDEKTYAGRGPDATATPVKDTMACSERVLRGGSFVSVPRGLRSAARGWSAPEGRSGGLGFRCVRGPGRQPLL